MDHTVTIVTVVKNDENHIEKTIRSVLAQDYPNIEYIVIDGASADNTVNIIRKYESRITYIISEPDFSIFDAMNKGISLASGKWINFMNSGDSFVKYSTISELISKVDDEFDFIYGNSVIENENGRQRLLEVNNNTAFWKRYINHQSTFIKTELLKTNPFDPEYDLCSDFDVLCRLHKANKKYLSVNETISIRKSGGKSDRNRIKAQIQKSIILKRHLKSELGTLAISIYLLRMIMTESVKLVIKRLHIRK